MANEPDANPTLTAVYGENWLAGDRASLEELLERAAAAGAPKDAEVSLQAYRVLVTWPITQPIGGS